MKTLAITLVLAVLVLFSTGVQADKSSDDLQMNIHIMMKLMNHALNHALEGANLQMLGQMGMANDQLDRDTIKHGTTMLKDGRQGIKDVLEGESMKQIYKESKYNKKAMDDLHELGERMLKVIDQAGKLHEGIK